MFFLEQLAPDTLIRKDAGAVLRRVGRTGNLR